MVQITDNQVRISVRHLVEFILRSGDIRAGRGQGPDPEAMQAGARLHRKIQKSMDGTYRAEVPLRRVFPVGDVVIVLEGRADGIITDSDGNVTIDEIKGMYADVTRMTAPIPVHRAQAMCYAYLYALDNDLASIRIRMTYATLETEEIVNFLEELTREELTGWFTDLIEAYGKWANFLYHHQMERNASIGEIVFPFEYRPGQKKLSAGVYRTIADRNRLFVQAPTGIGKTISVIYPSVKAMGEGKADRLYYLTAKTITRTAAEETFRILQDAGLKFSTITLTAKEKLCPLEECECDPDICPRARGHFDRVNDAVFELISNHLRVTREDILTCAETYCVCPHELDLDVSEWMDGIICDYNYVFDPNVYLKRYFSDGIPGNNIFLIDEAHNLPDRAREMYSAELLKEDVMAGARIMRNLSRKVETNLNSINRTMLALKRQCDDWMYVENVDLLAERIRRTLGEIEDFEEDTPHFEGQKEIGELYLTLRHFLNMYDGMDDCYRIYAKHTAEGFLLRLFCVNPRNCLETCFQRAGAAVFFSATLLPLPYYRTLLSDRAEDYTIYLESPFDPSRRRIMIGTDVTSRYTRRNAGEYRHIAAAIRSMALEKMGNYLVFAPSYKYLTELVEACRDLGGKADPIRYIWQEPGMGEEAREAFLAEFTDDPGETTVGFCVMGGIFSEGIDLTGERLIGVAVVGTGLPQVCTEREILKEYFDATMGKGFAYAYQYPGMNKVLQAAGRVIRTEQDLGMILLLDERFCRSDYESLFPPEWADRRLLRAEHVGFEAREFWDGVKDQPSDG